MTAAKSVLEAARRARLVGGVNELAGAAVRNLSDSAKQIEEDRRLLKERRQEQEVALGKLNGERQVGARPLLGLRGRGA